MAMNSVDTNAGAQVAPQSLSRTNDALAMTPQRISTGYRAADAKDDGMTFAVARTVRAGVAGLRSANERTGGIEAILDDTLASLNEASWAMAEVRSVLVKLGDGALSTNQRSRYEARYAALRTRITNLLADAADDGRPLPGAAPAPGDDTATTRDALGTARAPSATDAVAGMVVAAAPTDAAAAMAALGASGDFGTKMAAINSALNTAGSAPKFLDGRITCDEGRFDAMDSGLGALVDADLAKEAARMQALQIRQQLGAQSLSLANQAPQSLLSLFRG